MAKILVFDPDLAVIEAWTRILGQHRHEVIAATDAAGAEQAAGLDAPRFAVVGLPPREAPWRGLVARLHERLPGMPIIGVLWLGRWRRPRRRWPAAWPGCW